MNTFKLIEVNETKEELLVVEGELSAIEAKIVELKAAVV